MRAIKDFFVSKPWLLYVFIGVIIVIAGPNMFFSLPFVVKIISCVLLVLAFIGLGAVILFGDRKAETRIDTLNPNKIKIQLMKDKVVNDVMIIVYSAVVIFGTFIDSIVVTLVGIAMFLANVIAAIAARIVFTSRYRARRER